jgi:hypothetical protein
LQKVINEKVIQQTRACGVAILARQTRLGGLHWFILVALGAIDLGSNPSRPIKSFLFYNNQHLKKDFLARLEAINLKLNLLIEGQRFPFLHLLVYPNRIVSLEATIWGFE